MACTRKFAVALVVAVSVLGLCLIAYSHRKEVQNTAPVAPEGIGGPAAVAVGLPSVTGNPVVAASAPGAVRRSERPRVIDERTKRSEMDRKQRERQRWLAAKRNWKGQMLASGSGQESAEEYAEGPAEPVLVIGDAVDEATPPVPDMPDVASILDSYVKTRDRDVAIAEIRNLVADQPGRLSEVAAMAARGNREEQLLMADGLAAIGTSESMNELAKLILGIPPGDVRADLIEAAAKVSNTACAPYLMKTMATSGEEDLLQAAQRAVGNMCDQSLFGEIVARYANSQDEEERDNLLGAIRYINHPDAMPFLIEMAAVPGTDYENPMALAVIDTLGIIGTPEAVQALFTLLDASPADKRLPLMDAIARVINPECFELLAAIARGGAGLSVDARMAAINALSHGDPRLVTPLLQSLLQSDSEEIRSAARAALGPPS